MRQSFIVLSIFCIFLYVIRFLPVDFNAHTPPESLIPSDVLFIAKQYELEKKVNAFGNSRLGSILREIDYSHIARKLGFSDEEISSLDSVIENVGTFFSHPLIQELLGKEYTFALFQAEDPFLHGSLEAYLKNNSMIIARPKHHAKILELLSQIAASKASITESRYGGFTIKRMPVNAAESIAAVRIEDMLLLSFSERIIRRSINVFDGTTPRISDMDTYKEAGKHYLNSSFFSYLNVDRLLEYAANAAEVDTDSPVDSSLYFDKTALAGYKSVFHGTWPDKKSINLKTTIFFDPTRISEHQIDLLKIAAGKTDTYKRISSDVIWYYWTNVLRPEIVYTLILQRENNASQESDTFLGSDIEAITGFTPENLLSIIENDLLISIQSIPSQQFVPIPRFLAGIRLNNSDSGNQLIQNLIDYYDIPVISNKIAGVNVISWGGGLAVGDLQPSTAIVDGYLLFSSNRKQIKDFITLSDGKNTLADSTLFKKVDTGFNLDNNSLNFIHFAQLTNLTKEVINWAGTMIAIQDRETAQKSKVLLDLFCNPVLDGLSMYQAIGMRSYLNKNSILIESRISLENGK